MTSSGEVTRSRLLERSQTLGASDPDLGLFLKWVVDAITTEDLAPLSAEALEAELARAHAEFIEHAASPHMAFVTPPAEGAIGAPEVIDIFSPDMPFIVDSVLAAIHATGAGIRLIAHPILPLDRETGKLLATPDGGGRRESFLHIHIDPLPDPEARAALLADIDATLIAVAAAVRGWRPMLERLARAVEDLRDSQAQIDPETKIDPETIREDLQFLGWLAEANFTFLGMREYALSGTGASAQLDPVKGSGLGILADENFKFLRNGPDYVEMTPQHLEFLTDPDPLMVTKANVRSRVHQRSHMDYVGVKLFDPKGKPCGELRILGLFTSRALAAPHAEVPLLRRKLAQVMARAALQPDSHAGKALVNALDTYPRDELFQISQDQLFEFANLVAGLADRPRVRVLPRIDRFDNFVSILLFMPRERYESSVRARIGTYLAKAYDGRVSAYYPHFPEGEMVRVHFIIGRTNGPTPTPDRETLEAEITTLTRNFGDLLTAAAPDVAAIAPYREAFSPAYQSRNTPEQALTDIAVFKNLGTDIAIRFAPYQGSDGALGLKVYHATSPIPLSDRVPLLENFGFRVIDERTYTISTAGGVVEFLHDMVVSPPGGAEFDLKAMAPPVEAALLAVWHNLAESDGFNQLTVKAGLAWDDVAILRALGRYLRQLGMSFSQRYVAATLSLHPGIASALIELFHALNDPRIGADRESLANAARAKITAGLEATSSQDEDTIFRRLLELIEAGLRTNFYQRNADGSRRAALAIKFDCHKISIMPEPRPFREIFVYSPRVEGLHLRFGAIARGGIRWSDRPEDFRTEVLGLVKAQQVKNAIIVPVGAKGAFVPKQSPVGADRDTIFAEGTACYKIVMSTLLDVTDNIVGDNVVPPLDLFRREPDDPYLVVAADKGTASFSDTANAIAIAHHYWLGDAFASGGSVGYDHKKMGITARGGWEAVKRHFRELDRDIQTQPFTVVGVGDMSGDVFGNGMLLSSSTRLVAAFDHRDIFIDPVPDPARGLAERQRLFEMSRSSWQDYDRAALSPGGGIFSRAQKTADLSPAARAVLGLGSDPLTPQQVMQAILRADVDLLWFGGIGTYIRATNETDLDVGDKANDAIRVSAQQIRAKVIGEGANLGVTQRGRVEYALAGGRINSDAIDNSAGVNSSDLEVNIKIALGARVQAGQMTETERNAFLPTMTGEVAELCLRNNYLQTLAISLAQRQGLGEFPDHRTLIHTLEARGVLNREVEFLPTDTALDERAASGAALTRPELAVLLAYAKNSLQADLLNSAVPDDPYLGKELFRYFPQTLADTYPETITGHRLRREVIATVLANAMINRGGPAFAVKMMAATSADAGTVAGAYATARDAFDLQTLNARIDLLDGTVGGDLQLSLYAEIEALLNKQTLWFLRNTTPEDGLSGLADHYAQGVATVKTILPALLPDFLAKTVSARMNGYQEGGVPVDLAEEIAGLGVRALASDVILIAGRAGASIDDAAHAFFGVLDTFKLGRIIESGDEIMLADRFDRMALDRGLANLARAERDLAIDVLAAETGPVTTRLAAWRNAHPAAIERVIDAVADLTEGEITVSRLSVAAGLLSDLARSA